MSVTGFTYCNSSYCMNGLGDHHMGDLLKPLLYMSLPYKVNWAFCEELGFDGGRHVWNCVFTIMNLIPSWWLLVPHSLFMVEIHLSDTVHPFGTGKLMFFTHRV